MVTTVNTQYLIDQANEIADGMESQIDANCIRAATSRLAELHAEIIATKGDWVSSVFKRLPADEAKALRDYL